MKKIRFLLFLLIFVFLKFSLLFAGQIVTPDIKSWAKKVVKEEKLKPIEKNTLAVLYFHNKTDDKKLDPLQKGLALMLITDLSQIKGLRVIERIKLQALLEELRLGISGLVEPETAPRIGHLLGAYWVVSGDIKRSLKNLLSINSLILDVPFNTLSGKKEAQGKLEELFKLEKEILFEIIKILKIKITPKERKRLERPITRNTKALLALFKAIEASDNGHYEEAAELYEEALREDPNLNLARESLKELKTLGLLPQAKRYKMLWTIRKETSLTDQLTPEYPIKRVRRVKEVQMPTEVQPVTSKEGRETFPQEPDLARDDEGEYYP